MNEHKPAEWTVDMLPALTKAALAARARPSNQQTTDKCAKDIRDLWLRKPVTNDAEWHAAVLALIQSLERPSDHQTTEESTLRDKQAFEQWLRESMRELDQAWAETQAVLGPVRAKLLAESVAASKLPAYKPEDAAQARANKYNTSNTLVASARASRNKLAARLIALALLALAVSIALVVLWASHHAASH